MVRPLKSEHESLFFRVLLRDHEAFGIVIVTLESLETEMVRNELRKTVRLEIEDVVWRRS